MTTRFTLGRVPPALRAGLCALATDHPDRLGGSAGRHRLDFVPDLSLPAEGVAVVGSRDAVTVRYRTVSGAFRGLGGVLAAAAAELPRLRIVESSPFTMRGLMPDASRNGVMRPETLQAFLRRVALMGVNMVMMYTEDTYEVPGEPFFGYLRGPYTHAELKRLDDYAAALGIEMIPCIQTLAHLEQVLKWDPYFPLRDTHHILLPEDRKVYGFIRQMLTAASAPFRSKRIHIGMDEAHGLGTGRYQQLHGVKDPFAIMNTHLRRVRDLCREAGLRPMIWSDMYFRLGSKTHDYYDLKGRIPAQARRAIPRDVQLVYWDYYHAEPGFYRKMIARHRELGSEPVFSGGIWTWGHKWCALPWSFTAVQASMTACKREGVKEVFMTMWGDDGMEVDIFSALPGIQYFGEHAFARQVDGGNVRRRFEAACGTRFDDWVRAADIDTVPGIAEPAKCWTNTSVGLLWQDPLLPILDAHLGRRDLRPHYAAVEADLRRAAGRGGLAGRLEYPALVAAAIARKVNLRRDLAAAYRAGNKVRLRQLRRRELPDLQRAVRALWRCHRAMWLATYKPFGWEVIEGRYGGLMARLDTVGERLRAYLAGRIDTIPELEARLVDPWQGIVKDAVVNVGYHQVATPSSIK